MLGFAAGGIQIRKIRARFKPKILKVCMLLVEQSHIHSNDCLTIAAIKSTNTFLFTLTGEA